MSEPYPRNVSEAEFQRERAQRAEARAEELRQRLARRDRESLTSEQIMFAVHQFSRWLQIKEKYEQRQNEQRWQRGELTRHCADVDHSALLRRLLSGKEPLPEPPPLSHAYPVYPPD